ncbi:gamma-glutamylcyclotransferase [Halomonas aquamarina]|uniref:Gamma-glutamylcyclotransferase n=1 Tax=Vreelandella aquamarina TaxID=77097 RepID=A0ACC5VVN5_9GAMM|nr:gamma-glutamylcyclotransferase family protein [Halomonas aquamarina]MBZ5487851.1 gamma-glutamylcyclotransferase [Halomonas aquamarina]
MVWIKKWLQVAGVLMLGLASWLWLTMLSPWFYSPPDDFSQVEQRPHHVFVYGTLRYTAVRWIVMGRAGDPQVATLEGYHRNGLDVSVQPGSRVEGLLLSVTPDELEQLDRYERLGDRYTRERKTLADGNVAWVYVRLPETSGRMVTSPVRQIALVP